MVESVKDLQADYEEGERLAIFFGVLTTFNRGDIIKVELKREIEKFFDYKWIKEKNHALQHDDYENIVMQLPEDILDNIYTIFLYAPFVKVYSVIFEYEKDPKFKHSRYVWSDLEYRSFMFSIL